MTSHKARSRRALLLSAFCLMCGAALNTTVANGRTVGFHIYNLTGAPMKVKDILLNGNYPAKFDTSKTAPPPPRIGDVLSPGVDQGRTFDHNHIELESPCYQMHVARIFYGPVNGRVGGPN